MEAIRFIIATSPGLARLVRIFQPIRGFAEIAAVFVPAETPKLRTASR